MKKLFSLLTAFLFLGLSAQEMDGEWQSMGYARLLKIEGENYVLKDFTSRSCTPSMKGVLSDLSDDIRILNDTLILRNGINLYYFVRSEAETCTTKVSKKRKKDPLYNFDVLAETFTLHYAYFKERKLDWPAIREKYRSRIDENTTDPELFLIISEMLAGFGDAHIQFTAPEKIEKKAAILAEGNSGSVPKKNKGPASWKVAEKVAEVMLDSLESRNGGTLRWGIIDGNIGYLQLNQMLGFGEYGIASDATVPEFWQAYVPIMARKSVLALTNDEQKGIASLMDEALSELMNTRGLIIDVRFNGGGKDEVGLEVLSRLTAETVQAGTKKAVHKKGFSPDVPIIIEGSETPYQQPVCILTSRGSASATEIFVMSSLALRQVTRIGGNTEGITSDMLDKTLPNGWEFSLSNEIYLNSEGHNYEFTGITPDILVYESNTRAGQYEDILKDLEEERDEAIEQAIAVLLASERR